jgi:hypothetical protein
MPANQWLRERVRWAVVSQHCCMRPMVGRIAMSNHVLSSMALMAFSKSCASWNGRWESSSRIVQGCQPVTDWHRLAQAGTTRHMLAQAGTGWLLQ